MEVTFWGVRGTIPAPGQETNRYGGNTSCVTVRTRRGHLIILDCGTGLFNLGRSLMPGEFGQGKGTATVLLSHAHWDHIQGMPFFAPVFVPGNSFTFYGPGQSSGMLEGILEGQMNPHFSPLQTLRNLGATLKIQAIAEGAAAVEIDGIRITGQLNAHGERATAMAYRLEEDGRVLVYASDAGYPATGAPASVLSHYEGADVLIHDCTYTPEDRAARLERGNSSFADAADAAVRARVGHLVMFHYDQDYSDDTVDECRERCRHLLDDKGGRSIRLTAANEGLVLRV
jgi:phosphoribosyl 1,2-cyclic phosphodiesterase